MSVDIRSSDKRRYVSELQAREKEIAAGLLKASQPASPKVLQETEKRIRREIANSNERRRMQCINAGFSTLRTLIPKLEGEKLSKAAILQHATEYITSMEKDKTKLQMQLDHTKRVLSQLGQDRIVTDPFVSSSPPPSKRKKRDTESSDEGVGSLSDASDDCGSDLQRDNGTLCHQLEIEKQKCARLEQHICALENKLRALLQVQGAHSAMFNDQHPVSHLQEHAVLYTRKMADVSESHKTLATSLRDDSSQPLSPTPDGGMEVDTSLPLDATIRRTDNESTRYCAFNQEHPSSAIKLEVYAVRDASTPDVVSSAELSTVTSVTEPITTITSPQSSYLHNYCHRDHPRRRHRQQAQLEQQREEEERRQKEQQEEPVATSILYRPKHNTQNLQNLVEAIRQIEGDRILCGERKLYEEKLYDQHQSIRNQEESEREARHVSDNEELQLENSARDSLHRLHQQQQIIITSHPHTTSTVTINPKISISSGSSNFSEKYPIATHLLHRPLQPSYYRPGVIVHKQ